MLVARHKVRFIITNYYQNLMISHH